MCIPERCLIIEPESFVCSGDQSWCSINNRCVISANNCKSDISTLRIWFNLIKIVFVLTTKPEIWSKVLVFQTPSAEESPDMQARWCKNL
jgi:hypothetical protein